MHTNSYGTYEEHTYSEFLDPSHLNSARFSKKYYTYLIIIMIRNSFVAHSSVRTFTACCGYYPNISALKSPTSAYMPVDFWPALMPKC